MTYRVIWIESALDDLTALWTTADSAARKAMTAAVHALDRKLERDPFSICESRDPGEWVSFSDPLGVLVEIDSKNHIVWILSAWRFR
jgi:hypothetical protein